MTQPEFIKSIDVQRRQSGFKTIAETLDLAKTGNTILDPFSVLIGSTVELESGNVFYPNVIVSADTESRISIGADNVFYPNTMFVAEAGGVIEVGAANQFGDGGCSVKANVADAHIQIGDNGRYMSGAVIIGQTVLGSGSQILGAITAQNVTLQGGADYTHHDVDARAGLLKGSGLARNLTVPQGHVVNGTGNFADAPIEQQRAYHPKQ